MVKYSPQKNAEKITDIQEVLVSHSKHLNIANHEMSAIKTDMEIIKHDIIWIKDLLNKVDNRVWIILATIILGTLINIALRIYD
jgi:hypothetical protein